MPQLQPRHYTVEDIKALPENRRAELIDGEMYDLASPSRTHQQLAFSTARKIADYIDHHGGGCEVNIAPFAVFLTQDDLNYVEPDVTVICDPGKLDEDGCHGAPDWIIEVVSPSSERLDYGLKLFKYRSSGVKEYWIVNPLRRIVNVYTFGETPEGAVYSFGDEIQVGLYPGFSLRIGERHDS